MGAAVAVMSCTAPPPPERPAGDPRVFITPDLPLAAAAPIVSRGVSGLEVSLRLLNPTPVDFAVLATTDWIDAAGRPVDTVISRPRRITVPRFGDATVQSTAPKESVSDFRIRIEPDPTFVP
jgi:hypothetical protein